MKKLVLYHGDCLDGFCAAWMAWRKLGDEADYVPAYYGKPPPDVTGRQVFILDFSYSYEETLKLIDAAWELTILDHHKTAEEALGKIPTQPYGKVSIEFDMSRSGAGLARDYFHPGLECWLVDYTQDRDLWQFKLLNSKLVNAYIGTLAQTFEAYEHAHRTLSPGMASNLGRGADAYKEMYVEKMALHAVRSTFAGYPDIPVVNAPFVGTSELVGHLAESALFAVGWFQRGGDGKIVYSLRSRGDFDVAALAQKFGGGGHKNAAGFQLDWAVPEVVRP